MQTKTSPTVAAVIAGTLLAITYLNEKGERDTFKAQITGTGPNTLDLTDEGPLVFVDLDHKSQADRKNKLAETRAKGLNVAEAAFFSEKSQKYGTIIRCKDCGIPVRKWTSDLHQSHRCPDCTTKAKRAIAKANRKAKPKAVAISAEVKTS